MPIYEFECRCGHKEEKLVGIKTKTIKCPCCSRRMKKLISVSSFHLAGHGWAKDSYGLRGEEKKSTKPKPDKQ